MRDCDFAKRFRILLFLLLSPLSLQASFNKTLWIQWQVNNPLSTEAIDHHLWAQFLEKRLIKSPDGINRIDYAHMKPKDKKLLDAYIQRLSKLDIARYNRCEQLAFWINLYNALTVQTIAAYYPVNSIKDINTSPGLFSTGPWGANLVEVKGQPLSLDAIHNKIIRPIWNDPRTHYALNNGAIGAPNLQDKPFSGDIIETQLNAVATAYINSLRGVQVIEGNLVVSKIYKWYMDDFGGNETSVVQHIETFSKTPLCHQLKHTNCINTYTYNWHLNAT